MAHPRHGGTEPAHALDLHCERIDYAVSQTFGDVGVLFAVLRSESDFGGNSNCADHPQALDDIDDLVLQVAATESGFRYERFIGRLAPGYWRWMDGLRAIAG